MAEPVDLWVGTCQLCPHDRGRCDVRPASPADILAAVRTIDGVDEVTFFAPHIFPARDNPEYDLEMSAGRYLVVPIPEGEGR